MDILVAIPSNRDHSPHFVGCLVSLVQYVAQNGIALRPDSKVKVRIKTNCSNIATARNDLVQEAIDGGHSHLLFLDDDMVFPYDLLDSLCKYDAPVVAANCCQKKLPLTFTAVGLDGKRVDSTGKTGYEQVMRVGAAIMLIDINTIKNLPAPLFNFEWNADAGKLIGEDYYFCRLLSRAGVPIIIDHDASQHIGHIGAYSYGLREI